MNSAHPQPIFDQAQIARLEAGLGRFWRAYAKHIRENVVPALKKFDDVMWKAYRAAGAPYGDTHEGRMRWVREVGQARQEEAAREREASLALPLLPTKRPQDAPTSEEHTG